MKSGSTDHSHDHAGSERVASTDASEKPVTVPSQFPVSRASTGTVDDDGQPADEHDGENEASERETSGDIEAPEEFHRDDADRNKFDE